jgi:Spy/CpxP family protein refolding chaperone
MKKIFIVLAVVLAVAVTSAPSWAGPWGGRFYGMGPIATNLTPEQSSQVLALRQTHYEKIAPIQEQLFKKKMELRGLWLSQNPDQALIDALRQEVFALVDQLQAENSVLRTEMLKVLAPARAE